MSFLGRLFGYDETKEKDRCGVGPFSTDEHDPYHDACTWHDKATLKGSWHSLNLKVDRINKHFRDQMRVVKESLVAKSPVLRHSLNLRRQIYGTLSSVFTRFFATDPEAPQIAPYTDSCVFCGMDVYVSNPGHELGDAGNFHEECLKMKVRQ